MLEYYLCCFKELFLFVLYYLPKIILNISISGVKSSWTTLYIYQVMPGMTTYPVPTAAAVPTAAPVAKVKALLWPTKRAAATMRETLAKFMSVMLKLDFADYCLFHYSSLQRGPTEINKGN